MGKGSFAQSIETSLIVYCTTVSINSLQLGLMCLNSWFCLWNDARDTKM